MCIRDRDIPVLVKNPVSPDLELWIGAIERIRNAGIRRIGAIHRGFTSVSYTHLEASGGTSRQSHPGRGRPQPG